MFSNDTPHLPVDILNDMEDQLLSDQSPLVSDAIRLIFIVVNYAVLGEIVAVFGTFANIINIVIFIKMGFKDPVNVSLLGLAITDLGCCFTLIWLNICMNPLFRELDLPFDPDHIHYLSAGWPHILFTRVTSCITAFITLERCLCVTFPLKVKSIVTSKRVLIFLGSTYLIVTVAVAPIYYTSGYSWQFDADLNRSILRLTFTDDRSDIEEVALPITSIFLPVFVFSIVIICTALLVVTLRKKAKWRKSATTQTTSTDVSSRDTKISKMVITISTVFIACFFPIIILAFVVLVEKEFSIFGRYRNLFHICFSLSFLLESTNSSINIFIYYTMSSKYRTTFLHMLGRCPKE